MKKFGYIFIYKLKLKYLFKNIFQEIKLYLYYIFYFLQNVF